MTTLRTACWMILVLVVACGDDGGGPPVDAGAGDAAIDAGPFCTELLYDPNTGALERWPEPRTLIDDPATATGKRISIVAEEWPGLDFAGGFLPVFTEDLSDLDGFGINAQVYFRFGRGFDPARVPTGEATANPTAGLGLVVLEEATSPRIEPVLVRLVDDDTTPMMAPMHPLPPRATVAAFVTRALTDAAGGCLEPSPAMQAEIDAPDAEVSNAIAALTALGIIDDPSELVALTVYPTQSIVEDSVAVAADIATRDFSLDAPATCTTETEFVVCDATFTAGDYRDPDGVLRIDPDAVAPTATWSVPMRAWLPPTGTAPFPTIVFGHGLGSGREQGEELARFAAPMGIATIGIPSLQHGEHPSNPEPGSGVIPTAIRFFAIGDLDTRAFNGLVHRDYWRQSTYDKLQLTRLLQAGLDITGDGTVDLDPNRLAYLGASLGGIMGPELLALTDAYPVAVLAVPGGRVSSMISESDTFGPLVVALRPAGVTEGDVARFFPVLQTILERGDSASYGPHVLADRLVGDGSSPPPSVILGVALDDDTVPNVSNYTLARAIDVPIAPQMLRPVPGLTALTETPVSGNVAGGTATAGLLQFDVIRRDSGEISVATHSNTPGSNVGARAWLEFLSSHWNDGLAVIVDPYALEGLEHGAP